MMNLEEAAKVKARTYTNCLLLLIVILLLGIAVRPFVVPQTAQAQSTSSDPFYIEPGTFTLRAPDGSRRVLGKVVVDVRNGKVWGFPTLSPDPYPTNAVDAKPPTSHPFLLGRFALEDTEK